MEKQWMSGKEERVWEMSGQDKSTEVLTEACRERICAYMLLEARPAELQK